MKVIEWIAWGVVLIFCVGVTEMAVAAAGTALEELWMRYRE